MGTREFLKPSWKKFIFPVIILILLISIFFITKLVVPKFADLMCKTNEYMEEARKIKIENSSDKTEKLKVVEEKIKNELNNLPKVSMGIALWGNQLIKRGDPLYPAPCLIINDNYCSSYLIEEENECLNFVEDKLIDSLLNTNKSEYKSMNYLFLFLNWTLFLVLAYLISCFVSYVYHKIRRK